MTYFQNIYTNYFIFYLDILLTIYKLNLFTRQYVVKYKYNGGTSVIICMHFNWQQLVQPAGLIAN